MRTKEEIEDLRRDAAARLRSATRINRLKGTAERKSEALKAALIAMTEHRAVELDVEADSLSLDHVLVTDDEKALAREFGRAVVLAGATTEIGRDDTLDHVVARVAIERGWIIMDAARAILGDADARVDDLRNRPPHAKARRVRDAVHKVVRQRVDALDRQLEALRNGAPAMTAAPAVLAGALVSFATQQELSFEGLVAAVQAERDRLARILG